MKRSLPILAATLALLGAMAASPVPAAAQLPEEPPPHFTTFPEDEVPGSEAGRFSHPKAIAVDPVTRHVFVAEWTQLLNNNNRISEFDAWGQFVKAFGWGVRDGADELQTCTAQTGCREGLKGSQPGQFDRPNGIAFDAAGNLYVFERLNSRVQKFDPTAGPDDKEAQFLDEWGSAGTADGQFFVESAGRVEGSYIAVDRSGKVTPGGAVYVADKGRIQAFDTAGNFQFSFALPEGENGGVNPGALALDPVSGDLYFAFNQELHFGGQRPRIYRLRVPSGEVVDEIVPDAFPDEGPSKPVDETIALAVDPVGNLYAVVEASANPPRVQKYSPSGELLAEFDQPGSSESGVLEPGLAAASVGEDADEVAIYVSHLRAQAFASDNIAAVKVYGATPDPGLVGPPPLVPPVISDQYAVSVTETEASLRAAINPNFWQDTTYYLEYGTTECKASDCTELPTPPGSRLTTRVTKAALRTQSVFLADLEPNTKYFYRFVAQSTGGGPVYGIDPDGEGPGEASFGDGLEGTFTTRSPQPGPAPCPANEAFRPEPAKKLPDCRAYELVSPLDKNGADISLLPNSNSFPAGFDQADPSGEELSFAAYRAFAGSPSAPYTVQYLAARGAGGWSSRSIAAPRERPSFLGAPHLDAEHVAFTADLGQAFLFRQTDPLLDPAAPPGYANLYRRDNATGGYEALITTTPPNPPGKFFPVVQGFGGSCTVFQANDKLTADAANTTAPQLYKHCKGQPLELVSVLPNGTPAAQATAGTADFNDRTARWAGAVSADGQIVFWSDSAAAGTLGKLHARIGDSETIALSKGVAQFWAAAADGSKAIFTSGGTLYEFTLGENAKEAPAPIAGQASGVLGASSDASIVYFLSREDLEGDAAAGEPNLYRFDSATDSHTYIATLAESEASPLRDGFSGPVKSSPIDHTAQVTPDGGTVVFGSVASITGYDNTDAESGKPDAEVFVYRAGPDQLICASCHPTGARPSGREARSPTGKLQPTAAAVPTLGASSLYSPRVISDDGTRAYFNSYVPLAQGDTNGRADVYQWEALGKGTCRTTAPGYDPSYAGCVNLISGGESPRDSTFVDSSADGRDVFFKTNASLLPQDPGLIDIYDAREGGGFALQLPPPPECEGEACQSPAPAPAAPTPSSQAFRGPGNPTHCPKGKRAVKRGGKEVCAARRCPKGKRLARKAGKKACLKKRAHKKTKRANKAGRTNR